jgi:hypothetical protein
MGQPGAQEAFDETMQREFAKVYEEQGSDLRTFEVMIILVKKD